MRTIQFIITTITCFVATSFFTTNISNANTDTLPIGFQFMTANQTPIPNESFQLQIDNETKYITTKSDGLAFIDVPKKSAQTQYKLTTSNQQSFNVEANKLYQLTSSNNQISTSPMANNQSITINVLSDTFQPLSNIDVTLTAQNQVLEGKTDNKGIATINIPTQIPKESQFNVKIQGIDTQSTISVGQDKYYTYNTNNKTASPNLQSPVTTPQVDTNHSQQPALTPNNSVAETNLPQSYQISVAKDFLVPQNSQNQTPETDNKDKKTSTESKNLPDTGQHHNKYIKYIISFLILSIGGILFFVVRRKKSQQL
ncbi:LPXTG cell wall anchor domain-containing protein [Mammaliicoccus sp. Dog046]|uniref:LPXTG cell wall anchor domain-containing protein n=1 Tax=Mammaliicoccus sp. Dog046 TaxID=3034233 RepID=UPI002B2621D2|nr:LPXTG cell wall anchor domain-containing protein [Mammaliicoccus sp. Dog046]WQK86199.1 LPXTG cell wall anchor domain-containing protein [Mammaliicoccus sp. Dog046]